MLLKKCVTKIFMCFLMQGMSLQTMIKQQNNNPSIAIKCPICNREPSRKCPYPSCSFVTENKICAKTGIKSHIRKRHMHEIDVHNFFSQCEKCKKCKNIFEEYLKK